jgi:hypothetical protein
LLALTHAYPILGPAPCPALLQRASFAGIMALGLYDIVRGMALQAQYDQLQQAHEAAQQRRAQLRAAQP